MSASIEVAAIVEATVAEGPYERFALWVQGCSIRCPDCCNPEMFEAGHGERIEVGDALRRVEAARAAHGIEGITILGGEPLEQLPAVAAVAAGARRMGLGVIVFSGYRLERARRMPGFSALWSSLDALVDGPFVAGRAEPAAGRRYLGSTNQRILHRTLRYADPQMWRGPPTAQVDIGPDGRLTFSGFPIPVQRLVAARRP